MDAHPINNNIEKKAEVPRFMWTIPGASISNLIEKTKLK
jgi:hypothetical protein